MAGANDRLTAREEGGDGGWGGHRGGSEGWTRGGRGEGRRLRKGRGATRSGSKGRSRRDPKLIETEFWKKK